MSQELTNFKLFVSPNIVSPRYYRSNYNQNGLLRHGEVSMVYKNRDISASVLILSIRFAYNDEQETRARLDDFLPENRGYEDVFRYMNELVHEGLIRPYCVYKERDFRRRMHISLANLQVRVFPKNCTEDCTMIEFIEMLDVKCRNLEKFDPELQELFDCVNFF